MERIKTVISMNPETFVDGKVRKKMWLAGEGELCLECCPVGGLFFPSKGPCLILPALNSCFPPCKR